MNTEKIFQKKKKACAGEGDCPGVQSRLSEKLARIKNSGRKSTDFSQMPKCGGGSPEETGGEGKKKNLPCKNRAPKKNMKTAGKGL